MDIPQEKKNLEEEEEEEGLYLRIETRKRVQTIEATEVQTPSPVADQNHRSPGQHPGLPMPAFPPIEAKRWLPLLFFGRPKDNGPQPTSPRTPAASQPPAIN